MPNTPDRLPKRIWVDKRAFYLPEPPSYAQESEGVYYYRDLASTAAASTASQPNAEDLICKTCGFYKAAPSK